MRPIWLVTCQNKIHEDIFESIIFVCMITHIIYTNQLYFIFITDIHFVCFDLNFLPFVLSKTPRRNHNTTPLRCRNPWEIPHICCQPYYDPDAGCGRPQGDGGKVENQVINEKKTWLVGLYRGLPSYIGIIRDYNKPL